jgi:hypothetical protein
MANRLPTLESALNLPSKHMLKIHALITMCYKVTCSPLEIEPELDDFWHDLEDDTLNTIASNIFLKHGKHSLIFGHDAYAIHNKRNLYTIALIQNSRIFYLCNYAITQYHKKSMITQILVWNHKAYQGIARKMLLYWLSQYDIVFTNPSQYKEGIEMWKRFIKEHIHNLYFYRKVANSRKLERLEENYDESLIWGKTLRRGEHLSKYKQIFVYACKKPLINNGES